MKIVEFKIFLDKFDIVKNWSKAGVTVLYEALAQHYGLETEWLDITCDFNVALFFATCKWDKKSNAWCPLKKEDTERSQDTKYGRIFHIPQSRANLVNMLQWGSLQKNEEIPGLYNSILPIGY